MHVIMHKLHRPTYCFVRARFTLHGSSCRLSLVRGSCMHFIRGHSVRFMDV